MSKILDEIHKIREKIYEEEKNLTAEEILKKIRLESDKLIGKYNLKLRRVEKKSVRISV